MNNVYRSLVFGVGVLALGLPVLSQQRGAGAAAQSADWPTFGGDNSRTNANMAPTRITAANVGSMVRTQATISAPIDAGLIYLKGVQVNGASHDTFFGTTNLGRTVAIDATDGKVLWEFAPAGFDEAAAMTPPRGAPDANPMNGAKQITNSTPVADTNRQFIYAASADGKVNKISVADGKGAWSTAVTMLPKIEKMDSPLTFANGKVIVPTAGYVGDMGSYQGHVLVLNSATGAIEHVWNSLCSDRLELMDPKTCPQRQSAIWGRAGIVIDPATGNLLFATGNGNYDGKTAWGDALIMLDPTATKMLGNWTTTNNAELNQRDLDMGSTSPVLLGDGLIAQGGKDGTVRLVSMDIIKGTEAHQGKELQVVDVPNKAQLLSASATAKINGKTYLFVSQGGRGGGGGGRGGGAPGGAAGAGPTLTTAWTVSDRKLVEAWKSPTGGNSPFYAGGLLYIYNAGGGVKVLNAETGADVATLASGGGHWNSVIVADNRIALPEGAISGFGGGGGGGGGRGAGGGGRGGAPGGAPGGARGGAPAGPGGPGAGAPGGGGGRGRGGAPGGAPAGGNGFAPAAAQAPQGAPAIPQGIVNIWRLP